MAKRMGTIFLIVMGIALFLVFGFFMVLMLAPGFRAFGIQYVTLGTRVYDSEDISLIQKMHELGYDTFSGSIIIETDEIPVYVEFTQDYDYDVRYYENFSGFTKSNIDYPSVKVSRDDLGNAVIKVTGFKKWLYENSSTERFLKVNIPIVSIGVRPDSDVAGDTLLGYKTNFEIRAKTSDITFTKELEEVVTLVPAFNNFTIETAGKINYKTHIKAKTFKYTTENSITVDKENKKAIDAANYNLHSKNGRITVEKPVVGNLVAQTKNYDIKLISCTNLTATTEYGDIRCTNKDEKINVAGMVKISSKVGNVFLGKVEGTAQNSITTTSGKVEIQKILNGSITTKRGSVKIDSVNDVTISTNMGKVTVEEVLTKVDIDTVRGNIELGGEGMTINNADVFSRLGNVNMNSASQAVRVETIRGNVSFVNTDSENITLISGGKVNAKGLTGAVYVSANKNSEIEFTTITKDSKIELGDGCKTCVVWALENSKDDTRYILKGSNVTRYTDNDNGTGTFSKMESSKEGLTNRLNGTEPEITVTGKNADISVYFKAEAVAD